MKEVVGMETHAELNEQASSGGRLIIAVLAMAAAINLAGWILSPLMRASIEGMPALPVNAALLVVAWLAWYFADAIYHSRSFGEALKMALGLVGAGGISLVLLVVSFQTDIIL